MRILLFGTVLAIALLFGFNQLTFASCGPAGANTFVCNTNAPNPDPDGLQLLGNDNNLTVNVLPGAAIDTSLQPMLDDDGIELGDGNDMVTVDGGSVIGEDAAMNVRNGNNIITLTNAVIRGITDPAIRGGANQDNLTIENSLITSVDSDVMSLTNGEDIVTVRNSQLIVLTASGGDSAISAGNGADQVFIENSYLQGGTSGSGQPSAISLGNDDDTLTLGTGSELAGIVSNGSIVPGLIRCGNDFDTIVFAMAVPSDQVAEITAEIESKDHAGDSIVINRLFYQWEDCEELIPELTGGFISPVPTLSEWGLIATAGILGFIGFMVIRRRQVTA